jgi:hypothetical protein
VEERDNHLRREIHWIDNQIREASDQVLEINASMQKETEEKEALHKHFQVWRENNNY